MVNFQLNIYANFPQKKQAGLIPAVPAARDDAAYDERPFVDNTSPEPTRPFNAANDGQEVSYKPIETGTQYTKEGTIITVGNPPIAGPNIDMPV